MTLSRVGDTGCRVYLKPVTAVALFVCAAVVFSACRGEVASTPATARAQLLADAAAFLWSQQAEDGGWHSNTHGILAGGEAWTPFVAFYLFQVPDSIHAAPASGKQRALEFVRAHVNQDGVLGLSDPVIMEYPNYATSYGVRVLHRWGGDSDRETVLRMRTYLEGQQFTGGRGISTAHRAYGAWGFGETGLPLGVVGHVDLSHTRRVLEALRETGTDDEPLREALPFLSLLQKHPSAMRPQPSVDDPSWRPPYDGGFYASTTALGTNKAGVDVDSAGVAYYRSYATTTCDGLLSLLAAGVSADDEKVASALEWLRRNGALDTVDGIPPGSPGDWDRVLFFYHLLVRSEAYAAADISGNWTTELTRLLQRHKHEDGSFWNPVGAPNKEDDPLLATTFVIGALLNAGQVSPSS